MRIESPVVELPGTRVELVVVHPVSSAEWVLVADVLSAEGRSGTPTPVTELELRLCDLGPSLRARFRDFISNGRGLSDDERFFGQESTQPSNVVLSQALDDAQMPEGDGDDDTESILPDAGVVAGRGVLTTAESEPKPKPKPIAQPKPGVVPVLSDEPDLVELEPDEYVDPGPPPRSVLTVPTDDPSRPFAAFFQEAKRMSPPSLAVRFVPASSPSGEAATLVEISKRRSHPSPADGSLARGAVEASRHTAMSTEDDDPVLARKIALARARVVRRPSSATEVFNLSMLLVERAIVQLDAGASDSSRSLNASLRPSAGADRFDFGSGRDLDEGEGPTIHGASAVEEAIMALERVVALSPGHGEALGRLAELYLRCGRAEDADQYLRRAVTFGFRPNEALIRALERTHGLDAERG